MATKYVKYSSQPLKLMENRVWRTYTGGKLLEQWQGKKNPKCSDYPEEWVASIVHARNAGREHIVEGLSKVELGKGNYAVLKDLIDSNPKDFLGSIHEKKYNTNTGLLVKILNSRERLTIQVHPDKEFALKELGSKFGKTESWYILGGEKIDGEDPYVLLGFKPGITRHRWKRLFEAQDIQGMFDCLHKITINRGEVYLLESGVPHAIGSGCFLMEVQEPTDYTFRTERTTPMGKIVPDRVCHQGVGFEKMLDCFHYNGYERDETLRYWKLKPKIIKKEQNFCITSIVGSEHTSCFSVNKLEIKTVMNYICPGIFFTAVILSGKGKIISNNQQMKIKQSDKLFIPAGVKNLKWHNQGRGIMNILLCFPPE